MNNNKENTNKTECINFDLRKIEYPIPRYLIKWTLDKEDSLKQKCVKESEVLLKFLIADSHASGQKPITFIRQFIALISYPELLSDDRIFPEDVKLRARIFLSSCPGSSIGCYSHPLGLPKVRQQISKYIAERDNVTCDWENVFLTTGATEALRSIIQLVSLGSDNSCRSGIFVPIPLYTFYSSVNQEFNNIQIEYFLDEEKNWSVSYDELERALANNKVKCFPRAIIVINPGNPTGHVFTKQSMKNLIQFSVKYNLIMIADEVYQQNIHQPSLYPWFSFKEILSEMGPDYSNKLQLASVMSCSKGYVGECGFRGGFCELTNFDPSLKEDLYKALCCRLCPPVLGQALLSVVLDPPQENEPSYSNFVSERDSVMNEFKIKSIEFVEALNTLPGIHCNPIQGGMFAFPRLYLPIKAINTSKQLGYSPDLLYCKQLLDSYNVCFVPGQVFGQLEETFHFRVSIFQPIEKIRDVIQRLINFHTEFMSTYS